MPSTPLVLAAVVAVTSSCGTPQDLFLLAWENVSSAHQTSPFQLQDQMDSVALATPLVTDAQVNLAGQAQVTQQSFGAEVFEQLDLLPVFLFSAVPG